MVYLAASLKYVPPRVEAVEAHRGQGHGGLAQRHAGHVDVHASTARGRREEQGEEREESRRSRGGRGFRMYGV